jgi:uncharacterized protein (DUF362 family)
MFSQQEERTIGEAWKDEVLHYLSAHSPCGYRANQSPASEPSALAALALLTADHTRHDFRGRAAEVADWLASIQNTDGSVPVRAGVAGASWPTPLAVLAWLSAERCFAGGARPKSYAGNIRRAIRQILLLKASATPRVAGLLIAEGPGHVRDTQYVLDESGFHGALADEALPFVDLNYDDVTWTAMTGALSGLAGFYLPRSVIEADVIVSIPKMKTHHWVGVTASLKNLYGVIPGTVYGWPKNVLHHHGIADAVVDINTLLPATIAIVDAIECMEGDGPIMGAAKPMGLLVIGSVATAVDATACRLMDVAPDTVDYLAMAADRLGPIDDGLIEQTGEPWQAHVSAFQMPGRLLMHGARNSVQASA